MIDWFIVMMTAYSFGLIGYVIGYIFGRQEKGRKEPEKYGRR